jgi:hypothetical protein
MKTGSRLVLLAMFGLTLNSSAMFSASARDLYRCGGQLQDIPCPKGVEGKVVGKLPDPPSVPGQGAQPAPGSAAEKRATCKAIDAQEDMLLELQKVGGNLPTQERVRAQLSSVQKTRSAAKC